MLEILKLALPIAINAIPGLSTASAALKVVDLIRVGVPLAIESYNDLVPIFKTAITAAKRNNTFTDEQLADLDTFEKQIDDAFDAAALAALAEDAAAQGN